MRFLLHRSCASLWVVARLDIDSMKKICSLLFVLCAVATYAQTALVGDTLIADTLMVDTLLVDSLAMQPRHPFILDDMLNVVVHQDSAITRLLEEKSYNIQRGQTYVSGFRVQVYASNQPQVAKNEALNIYEKLSAELSDFVYVISEPPFWKVRIGNFLTREEANQYKNHVVELFPALQGSTYVVPDQVLELK